ncbi:hypothetical protein OSB04_018988 [Centaurea solstitialis]|uniref:Uncharacterized protein n=1 Tax=Centaurea solstitialis TaxID=347529 RepID=A0AA38T1P3_9ASTR|nr:hypothetical protein OSB04_018988 [Centaurea solstitialis]
MDTQETVLVSKVPMLKPNEFDMWKIRIRQYMLLTDYGMWEVVENGPGTDEEVAEGGARSPPRSDADRKRRQTEMKALSTLLFAIPNEYQHQFSSCTYAKALWTALEKRFSGTKSTKRNQKAILKQQYENFTYLKNESMTQTFDRFNKLIGEHATVDVKMDKDDVDRKFLRSLGEEWTIYTVSFRQGDDLEDKELEDLYNDLRIFEAEVEAKKRPIGYSHNAALLSSENPSSFNTTTFTNTTASYNNTTANETISNKNSCTSQESTDDTVLEAFLANHVNSSLINDDLDQINADDLEEMDIKWQMAMLTLRMKRFIRRTGRNNFDVKRGDKAGFNKSKVMCYKCNEPGHFARECKGGSTNHQNSGGGSSQASRFNNRGNNPSSSQALVSQEGQGFDWSDLAEEVVQNQALMAEIKETEIPSELTTAKDDLEKFSKSSKALESIIKAQVNDDLKRGIGYNNTPPPYNQNYIPPTTDLLDRMDRGELKEGLDRLDPVDTEEESDEKSTTETIPDDNHILTNEKGGMPFVPSKKEVTSRKDKGKEVISSKKEKEKKSETSRKESRKDHYTQRTVVDPGTSSQSQNKNHPRGNKRNWNNHWAQCHGVDLNKINRPKPCFICCKINHLARDCYFNPINQRNSFQKSRVGWIGKSQTRRFESTHKRVVPTLNRPVQPKRKVQKKRDEKKSVKMVTKWVPKALVSNTTASESSGNNCSSEEVNTAASNSSSSNSNTPKVDTTAGPLKRKPNIVTKYSSHEIPNKDYLLKLNRLAEFNYSNQGRMSSLWHVDSGCSRHMTCIMSLLEDFKRFEGGHVAFGDNPTGGKISGKGKVSKGFKIDESQVMLRTPRKDNVYCLDIEDASSLSSLNCLFSKASVSESSLWHRRMCHMNFKNMNLLVKNNLVRGLPAKEFSCDDHCVACLKGKKSYCLVIVDDYSRFTWVYFLRTKDETSGLIKPFVIRMENKTNLRVKVIRSDNGTEFKNADLNSFCEEKEAATIASHSMISRFAVITGSGTEQIQETSPPFVMFPMPLIDTNDVCTTDETESDQQKEPENVEKSDDLQTEETSLSDNIEIIPASDEGPQWDQEPKVNDSNLGVDLPEEPLHLTRTQKNHPPSLVIGDIQSPMITRKQSRALTDPHSGMISVFLSQTEPKKTLDAMKDPSWIEAMQEELLQFVLQHVWDLVDLPRGHRVIGTKWIFRNKTDERGIVIKNKSRLVAQGYTQEEGIDYDDEFAPVARIEAIRLFLAFASYKGFKVYQMDVKSAFLYGTIDEEVYVSQPPGFEDPKYPDKIYVDDIIFGSTKDDMCKEFEELMHKKFKMSSMGELTFFLGLQKFGLNDAKPASTPMETHKHLTADVEGEEVDVHNYRSMIGFLMYLTAFRPDIMFAVCVCARYQVRPKESHLHAVKRIFKYLKGQPRLGLWYPNDSSFDLVAYTDSNYGGANLDRKSTSGGCQFLGGRLVSWQCKKQTTVSQSTTEAEYIAASQCCSQVLWIQNQMQDYGLSFLQTPIYIDNNSHNKIGYLTKDSHSEGFEDIVDFLASSNIAYAATIDPIIYVQHMHDFWANATIEESEGVKIIRTTICGHSLTVTPATIRLHLHLNDESGTTMLTPSTIMESFLQMGYAGSQTSLKYLKGKFCPQWRFFVHTLLHCFSKKTTSWSEFSSTMASALVCLATNQTFNFSKMIFDDLVYNLENINNSKVKPFYMFPRFVQEVITRELTDVPLHGDTYKSSALGHKVFSNMKRPAQGSNDQFTPLFPTMMGVNPTQGEASGLQPTKSSIPTDDLPTPSTTKIPQSLESTPTPSLKGHTRKNRGAPSSSDIFQRDTPGVLEHSPSDIFQRDTPGVLPHSSIKKVPSMEKDGHVVGEAQTTDVAQGVHQDSLNIAKTPTTATPIEQSSGGPRCQETKGVASASARLKTSVKKLKDPHDQKHDSHEGRLDLLEELGTAQHDLLKAHDAQIIKQSRKIQAQGAQMACMQMKISALQRRYSTLVSFTKGERRLKIKGELKKKKVINEETEVVNEEFEPRVDAVEVDAKPVIEKEAGAKGEDEKEMKEAGIEVNEDEVTIAELLLKLPMVIPTKGVVINKAELVKKKAEELDPKDK